jgi:hypothetical protein
MRRMRRYLSALTALAVWLSWSGSVAGASGSAVDTSTLNGKLVVGFQGWFMCPGDAASKAGWWHWFTDDRADAAHVHFDFLPDTSELDPDERCATGLTTPDGRPIWLFSDQNPKTVLRQFQWMRTAGIETVALQRFVVDIDPAHPVAGAPAVNQVLRNVQAAAEATGRSFFVMYDIVGADNATWADTLARDWATLNAQKLTASPAYQRHKGHPVLAIAGVGSDDRPGTAPQMLALVRQLRSATAGGVTLMGEVATHWRTLDGDSKTDPAWSDAYRAFDILSPWTVGRFEDSASFDSYRTQQLEPDLKETQRVGIQLMPVLYPGYSSVNQSRGNPGPAEVLNKIPRRYGSFMQMQADAYIKAGAPMMYGAMFDEVDEGTALFKMVALRANLPSQPALVPLDDGDRQISSDFYLRLTGSIALQLKNAQRANAASQHGVPRPPTGLKQEK